MIMTKGNQLPTSDNALYLRPAWENGYVGKFTEDCFCFCRGCNYTILVSARSKGYITVGAKVSGMIVDISSSDGVMYDSVLMWHAQCYSYKVTNKNKDLRIRVDSFSGDPDVYVNPVTMPWDLSQAAFNSRDHFENEELVLTPKERKSKDAVKGEYIICVYGNTASTFKITIKNEDHDVFLSSGLSESGYADTNETSVYYFRDKVLAEENVDLKFTMHVMFGKARLRAKVCAIQPDDTLNSFKDSCTFTQEEMLAEDPEEQIQQHIGAESEKTDTSICKMPESTTSIRNPQVTCVYAIGVIGLADFQSHFSVMVKIEKEAEHTLLREGVPAIDEIKEIEPKYFKFSINDPDVKKITV